MRRQVSSQGRPARGPGSALLLRGVWSAAFWPPVEGLLEGEVDAGADARVLGAQVSDVSDDVRRAAVLSLGFVLYQTPEQCPRVVRASPHPDRPHLCDALTLALAHRGRRAAGSRDGSPS